MVHDVLQHRPARARSAALAVDHAHATLAARRGFADEGPQCLVCGVPAEAVQVDLGLHRVLAAAQATEHLLTDSGSAKRQFLAGVEDGRVGGRQQAFAQYVEFVGAAEAGDRSRLRRLRTVLAPGQRPHFLHRLAEGLCVVFGHAFKYSAANSSAVSPLRILVSNDDGYRAEGLQRLADALHPLAEVTVVAPDRNRSGASHSLTLDVPLRVANYGERMYYVNGTPTDCVHLAISGLFDFQTDMVVSGINDGANLGDDVLYSGTVAAAIEGRFLGLPTMAVSLVLREGRHFDTAARVASELVMRLMRSPLHASMILNVNVPDLPYEQLAGFRATRLGHRHRSEAVVRTADPRGRPVYWVGAAGEGADAGEGTDFAAIAGGYVSVTPLQVDLTRHASIADIGEWLVGRAP